MKVQCPSCSKSLSCGDEYAGKHGKCPKCRTRFKIPDNAVSISKEQQALIANSNNQANPISPDAEHQFQTKHAPSQPAPSLQTHNADLFHGDYVSIWKDGRIEARVTNIPQAKLAIKSLRLFKRQLRIASQKIHAELRQIRHEYTDYTRTKGIKFPGRGTVGQIVRLIQTVAHESQRHNLASNTRPLHDQKEALNQLIIAVDSYILKIEAWILDMKTV